jgi:hypothetical protein
LSGISTLNTPPKNSHAASQPAITAVNVWEYVNHTNMCRDRTAVKINACTRRRLPVSGSAMKPIWAKSIWHSTPGSPSATRTVLALTRKPHRSTANRCKVRYGTTHPERASSSSTFTTESPSLTTQVRICSSRPASTSHAAPCPAGRDGRTAVTTAATSSSSTAARAACRDKPAAWAACTYRRAVLRSTPARSATFRRPTPASQPRSTSRTSTTPTSLNPTAADLHVFEHDVAIQRANEGPHQQARRVVP